MIVDKNQLFNVWLKSAMIHLDMADAGFERKYPDQVFFNCQQALEKLSKGIYILLVSPKIPHVHAINDLFHLIESQLTEPVNKEMFILFEKLSNFYKGGRYPDEYGNMSFSVDIESSEIVLDQTKEPFQWLLKVIPKLDSAEEDQAIHSEQPKPSPKP